MKPFRIQYPISEEVKTSLGEYPNIASSIVLPSDGYSELELIRLFDNQHLPHIKELTTFIEESFPFAGEIGKKVLDCKDPFQFAQAISELYLLKRLFANLGSNVTSASFVRGQSGWDISANIDSHEVRIEVYTPIELAGHQLFERLLISLLKYLDLPIGYNLDVRVGIQRSRSEYNQRDLFYTYDTGYQEEVNEWLHGFEKKARSWIRCKSVLKRKNQQITIPGPGSKLKVTINITDWARSPRERSIVAHWPTKSSDTKLFFENKNPENIANNEWGRKIRQKLFKQQCGETNKDYLRMLIVNFMLADSGWPEFISEDWFTTNFNSLITYLVNDKQPYDVVITAQLGFECCFGKPAWISDYHRKNRDYIAQLGIDKQCVPPPTASQEEIDEIVNSWETADE